MRKDDLLAGCRPRTHDYRLCLHSALPLHNQALNIDQHGV
jgi:hypothetical protein